MKRCPRCSQVYTDDMSFCLSDGTPLVALMQETDDATFVKKRAAGTVPEPAASSGLWLKILAAAVVVLFGFFLLAGIAVWMLWPRDVVVVPGNGNNSNVITPTPTRTPAPTPTSTANTNEANLKTQQEELERERKRLEDERRRLEEEKNKPPATPERPPQFNDPGTTRITFARGRVGETVAGMVGRQRTFVLRTLAGQYLSAMVRSSDRCVTFSDGSSISSYRTSQGDSYLYLRNNCSEPARFTMSITVR